MVAIFGMGHHQMLGFILFFIPNDIYVQSVALCVLFQAAKNDEKRRRKKTGFWTETKTILTQVTEDCQVPSPSKHSYPFQKVGSNGGSGIYPPQDVRLIARCWLHQIQLGSRIPYQFHFHILQRLTAIQPFDHEWNFQGMTILVYIWN